MRHKHVGADTDAMDGSYWLSVCLLQWLAFCVGCSPVSSVIHTSTKVGLTAVLPCTVTSRLEPVHKPHIQWQTVRDSVFERMGDELFQGETYRDRVDVPESMLVRGNCSLFLRDVQFSDAGTYESYLVVGEASTQSRVLIQIVQLTVIDHKSIKSVQTGGDLILDLYTHQAELVIFQNSNETTWTVMWERDGAQNNKVHLRSNKLIFSSVTTSSGGLYKVLDSQGLALSTVKVFITDPVLPKESEVLERKTAIGKATTRTPVLKIILLFLTLHLVQIFN